MDTPCRFYALGSCTRQNCPYRHDKKVLRETYCQFYLQGKCKYGDYCALPHIKPQGSKGTGSKASVLGKQQQSQGKSGWKEVKTGSISIPNPATIQPQQPQQPQLCPFGLQGTCRNKQCKYLHGRTCHKCNKQVLDPRDSIQQQQHLDNCQLEQPDTISSEMECVVCMEKVLEKSDPRFGLLDCDHCACLECIRKWRTLDGISTSKCCPICRTVTYFVCPSGKWPRTRDEKHHIIQEYRQKLRSPC